MSSINTAQVHLRTYNGAPVRHISAYDQLRRTVMSCFLWEKEFYEEGQDIAERIRALIPLVDPGAVATFAVEARNYMHLRHVPLLIVREMARLPSHKKLVARTLPQIIQRADELTEFLALYWKEGRCPLSAQVKKGLAKAFVKFNEYSLAKYNRDGKSVKLRDVMFLSHAKPAEHQVELFKRVANDTLETPDTWEVALSACKTSAEKTKAWERLIIEEKLGGLAVLRNLRNMQQANVPPHLIREAIASADYQRVLPFRFIAAVRYAPAYEEQIENVLMASIKAKQDILPGKTIVLVDVSGSMDSLLSAKSDMTRMDAANGVAMILREVCPLAGIFSFSTHTMQIPSRKGFALRDAITNSQPHGGTCLGQAVIDINRAAQMDPYDRIVVISDEQTSDVVPNPLGSAKGYMINVASAKNGVGYGKWTHIDGFSEAVVKFIIEYERAGVARENLKEGEA